MFLHHIIEKSFLKESDKETKFGRNIQNKGYNANELFSPTTREDYLRNELVNKTFRKSIVAWSED